MLNGRGGTKITTKLVSRKEWIFPLVLAIIVPLITLIPVIHGYMTEPEGKEFMGIVTNVVDSNTYFDYMNQAADGHFIFRNSYTSEEMRPLLIRPLYWFIGLFTIFLPSIIVYHGFRVLFSALFILFGYYFISYFLKEKTQRRFAITALSVGSGFGWILLIINNMFGKGAYSTDILNFESIPFLSMNTSPHFIFSFGLIMGIMLLFYKGASTNDNKLLVYAGLLGLLMGFVHIYNMVTIYLVTGSYFLIKVIQEKKLSRKRIVQAIIFYGISIPSAIYYFIVFTFDPVYHYWKDQNVLPSPEPFKLIAGLGLLFILGVVWAVKKFKEKQIHDKELFLLIWFIVNFVALYLPFAFQIRFIEGYFIPISILGTLGFFSITKCLHFNKKLVVFSSVIVILMLMPSNAYLYQQYFSPKYYPQSEYSVPASISDEQIKALIWLSENTHSEQVVLADSKLGNYVPRISGNKVYAGHWAQTIEFTEKNKASKQIFLGTKSVPQEIDIILTQEKRIDFEGFSPAHQSDSITILERMTQ